MEGLTNDFNIEGCDCSTDMMKMAGSNLKIFCWDIVKEGCPKELAKWDVLFCRGVFSSIVENKARLKKSIENTLNVTKKALIIWEWPEVLEKIRVVSTDERLILKPIEHLDE